MKAIIRLSVFLLTILSITQCTPSSTPLPERTRTVVCGKITTPNAQQRANEMVIKLTDYRGNKTLYIDTINADRTFKIEFDLFKTQDIELLPVVGRLLMQPGDSIYINVDLDRVENIAFETEDKLNNKALIEYLHSNYSDFRIKNAHTLKMTPLEYKAYLEKQRKRIEHRQKMFIAKHAPSEAIKSWINSNIEITFNTALLDFPIQYCNYKGLEYSTWQAPADYYEGLDILSKLAEKEVLNSAIYNLLNSYNWQYLPAIIGYNTLTNSNIDSAIFHKITNKHSGALEELLIGNIFYTYLNADSILRFDKKRTLLDKYITSNYIKIPLTSYYKDKKKALENPILSNQTEVVKLKAEKNIIQQIVSDHKGSHIYIDCWAPWCTPCLDEMPFNKQLYTAFSFTNLEFVYVCLDSDKAEWEQKLTELQIPGRHYFCDKAQSKSLRQELGIDQIPYYAIIDKSGKTIDKGNHLRPSIPLTRKKISEVLQP